MDDLDWDGFFAHYEPMARRFVQGLCRDAELARDLFQEAARAVFERHVQGGVRFESSSHARNYLFQVLRNLAVDARRDRARPRPVELGDAAAEVPDVRTGQAAQAAQAAAEHERRDAAIRRGLSTLRPAEQEVVRLRYQNGMTFREISARTGTAISTLQARVESALGKIRRKLGKPGGEA